MKIFLFLIIFATSFLLFGQSVSTQMHYDAGGVLHQGKRYVWSYKKPAKIAENCGCEEAARLFKKADKQLKTFLLYSASGIGVELLLFAIVQQSNGTTAPNYNTTFLPAVGGLVVILPGYIPYYKWAKNGPRAVYEYNRCIEGLNLESSQ
jgi:hypothetical protein